MAASLRSVPTQSTLSPFECIYKAARAKDEKAIAEIKLTVWLDVFSRAEGGTPVQKLAREDDVKSVEFLLAQGALPCYAAAGFAQVGNYREVIKLLEQVQESKPSLEVREYMVSQIEKGLCYHDPEKLINFLEEQNNLLKAQTASTRYQGSSKFSFASTDASSKDALNAEKLLSESKVRKESPGTIDHFINTVGNFIGDSKETFFISKYILSMGDRSSISVFNPAKIIKYFILAEQDISKAERLLKCIFPHSSYTSYTRVQSIYLEAFTQIGNKRKADEFRKKIHHRNLDLVLRAEARGLARKKEVTIQEMRDFLKKIFSVGTFETIASIFADGKEGIEIEAFFRKIKEEYSSDLSKEPTRKELIDFLKKIFSSSVLKAIASIFSDGKEVGDILTKIEEEFSFCLCREPTRQEMRDFFNKKFCLHILKIITSNFTYSGEKEVEDFLEMIKEESPFYLSDVLAHVAVGLFNGGYRAKGLEYLRRLQKKSDPVADEKEKAKNEYIHRKNYIKVIDEIQKCFNKKGYREDLSRELEMALLKMAAAVDPNKAYDYALLFPPFSQDKMEALKRFNWGILKFDQGNKEKFFKRLNKSINEVEARKNPQLIFDAYMIAGEAQINSSMSIKNFEEAHQIKKKYRHVMVSMRYALYLGEMYYSKDELAEAVSYFQIAFDQALPLCDGYVIGTIADKLKRVMVAKLKAKEHPNWKEIRKQLIELNKEKVKEEQEGQKAQKELKAQEELKPREKLKTTEELKVPEELKKLKEHEKWADNCWRIMKNELVGDYGETWFQAATLLGKCCIQRANLKFVTHHRDIAYKLDSIAKLYTNSIALGAIDHATLMKREGLEAWEEFNEEFDRVAADGQLINNPSMKIVRAYSYDDEIDRYTAIQNLAALDNPFAIDYLRQHFKSQKRGVDVLYLAMKGFCMAETAEVNRTVYKQYINLQHAVLDSDLNILIRKYRKYVNQSNPCYFPRSYVDAGILNWIASSDDPSVKYTPSNSDLRRSPVNYQREMIAFALGERAAERATNLKIRTECVSLQQGMSFTKEMKDEKPKRRSSTSSTQMAGSMLFDAEIERLLSSQYKGFINHRDSSTPLAASHANTDRSNVTTTKETKREKVKNDDDTDVETMTISEFLKVEKVVERVLEIVKQPPSVSKKEQEEKYASSPAVPATSAPSLSSSRPS